MHVYRVYWYLKEPELYTLQKEGTDTSVENHRVEFPFTRCSYYTHRFHYRLGSLLEDTELEARTETTGFHEAS